MALYTGRRLAVVLALCLTLAPLAAEAQEAGKVYRVGFVAITLRGRWSGLSLDARSRCGARSVTDHRDGPLMVRGAVLVRVVPFG